ncbi:uncharacterized protein LOC144657629 [Oculina patagonica]
MSINRGAAHRRRSPPIITTEDSQLLTQAERRRERDDVLNRDLHTAASLESVDQGNATRVSACTLPAVISHSSSDGTDSLETGNPSDQDETRPSLPEDIKRVKQEVIKKKFYQEKALKVKGNLPSYNMSYQAPNKKAIRKFSRKRCRSYSCSDTASPFPSELELNKGNSDAQQCLEKYDHENVYEDKQSISKLPSIFEKNMANSRSCASACLKIRRSQQYIGITDTLLDKDLRSKVKEFLQAPQPKSSTPSLRIKRVPDVQLQNDKKGSNHNTDLRTQLTGVPINTDTCPLMSHFKDRKWYYQDKSGKCCYLRVPESPVPPVSFVFTKD